MLTISPHCINKLQPLDVGLLKPFQTFYNAALDAWMMNHAGDTFTIYNFASCVEGEKVRLQISHRNWASGNVMKHTDKPRSHIIQTTDGRTYRKNPAHLHKAKAEEIESTTVIPSNKNPDPIHIEPLATTIVKPSVLESNHENEVPRTIVQEYTSPKVIRSGRLIKPVKRLDL
ncbi:hypothetical protein QE152_g9898 [Popillia japonica]|uniref:Uncharacterized protein n=1 Tax=Popillia japonica TaxID=7064 RepID=A0AAW1LWJ7_POPJA